MASRGALGPKIRIGPKGYCRPKKKRRQVKKSKRNSFSIYEFVYEFSVSRQNVDNSECRLGQNVDPSKCRPVKMSTCQNVDRQNVDRQNVDC